jgi:N4-gp56 family major capsid protein
MASNASAGLSATLMKQYWIEQFLTEFRSNLVFRDLGLRGKVPQANGQVVHWLSLADLSVNTTAATENTDPTSYSLSGGDKQATLTPYNDSVQMSRQLAQTWISGSMDDVLNRLARLAAAKIDRVIRDSVLTAGGVAKYAGSAVARNSIPQDNYFIFNVTQARKARNFLEQQNITPHTDGFYVCVSHPDSLFDIEGDANWRDVLKYDQRTFENIIKGEVGEINKIRFIKTSEAFNSAMGSGSTAATVYQNYVMGAEAYGVSDLQDVDIIVKDPAPASAVNGYSTVGYYVAFATRALQTSALIRVEAVSSVNS